LLFLYYTNFNFSYLKETYGIEEFLTSRINQDPLENFFSWIRSAGLTYTTPTSLDFGFRFKKYLLSKSTSHFAEKSNCIQETSSHQNICSELLLNLQPAPEDNTSCLSADIMDLFVNDEVFEEESDFEVPRDPPVAHHRSRELQNYNNKLAYTNGVLIMASFLASKFP